MLFFPRKWVEPSPGDHSYTALFCTDFEQFHPTNSFWSCGSSEEKEIKELQRRLRYPNLSTFIIIKVIKLASTSKLWLYYLLNYEAKWIITLLSYFITHGVLLKRHRIYPNRKYNNAGPAVPVLDHGWQSQPWLLTLGQHVVYLSSSTKAFSSRTRSLSCWRQVLNAAPIRPWIKRTSALMGWLRGKRVLKRSRVNALLLWQAPRHSLEGLGRLTWQRRLNWGKRYQHGLLRNPGMWQRQHPLLRAFSPADQQSNYSEPWSTCERGHHEATL